jgi:hypothetical protein
VATKQQLLNQMIAAAAKFKTDHNSEKESDAQKWLDTRQNMIDERTQENLQHQEALTLKANEMATRARQYDEDVTAERTKHSD